MATISYHFMDIVAPRAELGKMVDLIPLAHRKTIRRFVEHVRREVPVAVFGSLDELNDGAVHCVVGLAPDDEAEIAHYRELFRSQPETPAVIRHRVTMKTGELPAKAAGLVDPNLILAELCRIGDDLELPRDPEAEPIETDSDALSKQLSQFWRRGGRISDLAEATVQWATTRARAFGDIKPAMAEMLKTAFTKRLTQLVTLTKDEAALFLKVPVFYLEHLITQGQLVVVQTDQGERFTLLAITRLLERIGLVHFEVALQERDWLPVEGSSRIVPPDGVDAAKKAILERLEVEEAEVDGEHLRWVVKPVVGEV